MLLSKKCFLKWHLCYNHRISARPSCTCAMLTCRYKLCTLFLSTFLSTPLHRSWVKSSCYPCVLWWQKLTTCFDRINSFGSFINTQNWRERVGVVEALNTAVILFFFFFKCIHFHSTFIVLFSLYILVQSRGAALVELVFRSPPKWDEHWAIYLNATAPKQWLYPSRKWRVESRRKTTLMKKEQISMFTLVSFGAFSSCIKWRFFVCSQFIQDKYFH